jgi:hypothetical protein
VLFVLKIEALIRGDWDVDMLDLFAPLGLSG